jgi:hypothetical protein
MLIVNDAIAATRYASNAHAASCARRIAGIKTLTRYAHVNASARAHAHANAHRANRARAHAYTMLMINDANDVSND